jgi:hypothetical protein
MSNGNPVWNSAAASADSSWLSCGGQANSATCSGLNPARKASVADWPSDSRGGGVSSLEGGPGLGRGGRVSVVGDEDEGGLEVTEGTGEFGLVFELGGKGVKHGEDETTGGGTNTGGSPRTFSGVARKHCRFWHAGVHRSFFWRRGVWPPPGYPLGSLQEPDEMPEALVQPSGSRREPSR